MKFPDYKEKSNKFYDKNLEKLKIPLDKSPWLPIYKKSLDMLSKNKNIKIMDLGCGTGRLAKLLFRNGYLNYIGIDFSSEAINIAKKYNSKMKFIKKNLFNIDLIKDFGDIDFFIILEVLEHINDDIKLIERIPENKNIIFSVPNYVSDGHVRAFNSPQECIERYDKYLKFINIYVFTSNILCTHFIMGSKEPKKIFPQIFIFKCLKRKKDKSGEYILN